MGTEPSAHPAVGEPASPPEDAALFAAGGEMGARMREIDWASTPLGPVHSWPQSLRTCVRIVLTSRQPMFVWWGDSLINLYNDAYKSIVGGKHPDALGQPASVVWREIWDQIAPRAEASMRRNEGTYDEAFLLVMERNGYREETYYTFSYSPVPNDQGGTGGILCANTDDTQRILGERRLALLRDLAARTGKARTAEDVGAQAATSFATNPKDLPFGLVYLLDPERTSLRLVCAAGIAAGHPAAPEHVQLGDDSTWPFSEVVRLHRPLVVGNLETRFANLPRGVWRQGPSAAVALPVAPSGETGRAGVLLVGLNPFRLFDEEYASFLDLVAGQLAASIANAEAHEAERHRAEMLSELDRAKTTFFSNVSHEFRTPLTLILASTAEMRATRALDEGDPLSMLHRNALRLLKLVNTLLDFSRIEAGRVEAAYEATELGSFTTELAASFRAATDRAGLRLVVDCPAPPEPVYVDRDMWEKIVLNLLSNAVKFTFEGTITVRLRASEESVELSVSDTGTGIAAAELPRVFERFHRVEGARARSHEGSGIGLALVQELVRMHGGSIAVTSELGEGSTFAVRLRRGSAHLSPLRIRAERALESTALGSAAFVEEAMRWLPAADRSDLNAGSSSWPPVRAIAEHDSDRQTRAGIVIADDNADMRAYLTRLLSERWKVRAFPDGAAALAAIRSQRPDLVLTDIMMPNLDGLGLLRELRSHPDTKTLPVIVLSARAGPDERVAGVSSGADDYVVKPFSARELVARVAAQIELARLRGVAEAERVRFRQLFLHAPAYIAIYRGPEHIVDFVNHEWAHALLDSPERAVIGVPARAATPGDAEGLEMLDRVYRSGETLVLKESPWRSGPADAPARFLTWVVQPTRDARGAVDGTMTFGFDVTESLVARNRLEELRRSSDAARRDAEEAREQAEAASRAKDEFLAMLGHELRNPLSPMLTALQLMRLRGDGSMQRERDVLERQVRHLTRLVEDLLDVSRVTRGKITLSKERVQLAEVVAKAVEMAGPLIEQRGHRLSVDVPRRGFLLWADPVRLAQVISNLLTNAAKYTPARGTISIQAEKTPDETVIRVRDSGEGMPPELLPRVFDLFAQGGRTIDRSQGGLGIGLSIVQSLVTLHGGSVTAQSDGPGRGSEFVVRLPRDGAEDAAPAPPPAVSAGDAGRAAKLRVLVVDDNCDAAKMLGEALALNGCELQIVFDGPSAIEAALSFRPDVAFLDIGLPVMDGYEVARRLRAEDGLRHLKLIAVTGYGQASDRRRAREAGYDEHVVKPIDIEALPQLLRMPSADPRRGVPAVSGE